MLLLRRRHQRIRFVFESGKKLIIPDIIYCEAEKDGISVEIALQYNDAYTSSIYSFANNIHTHEGGTHEEGFRMALTRCIKNYATEKNMLKKMKN